MGKKNKVVLGITKEDTETNKHLKYILTLGKDWVQKRRDNLKYNYLPLYRLRKDLAKHKLKLIEEFKKLAIEKEKIQPWVELLENCETDRVFCDFICMFWWLVL